MQYMLHSMEYALHSWAGRTSHTLFASVIPQVTNWLFPQPIMRDSRQSLYHCAIFLAWLCPVVCREENSNF